MVAISMTSSFAAWVGALILTFSISEWLQFKFYKILIWEKFNDVRINHNDGNYALTLQYLLWSCRCVLATFFAGDSKLYRPWHFWSRNLRAVCFCFLKRHLSPLPPDPPFLRPPSAWRDASRNIPRSKLTTSLRKPRTCMWLAPLAILSIGGSRPEASFMDSVTRVRRRFFKFEDQSETQSLLTEWCLNK